MFAYTSTSKCYQLHEVLFHGCSHIILFMKENESLGRMIQKKTYILLERKESSMINKGIKINKLYIFVVWSWSETLMCSEHNSDMQKFR